MMPGGAAVHAVVVTVRDLGASAAVSAPPSGGVRSLRLT